MRTYTQPSAVTLTLLLACGSLAAHPASNGNPADPRGSALQEEEESEETSGRRLVVVPAKLELDVGDETTIEAYVVGPDGTRSEEDVFFFSRGRRSVSVDRDGLVKALASGSYSIVARTRRPNNEEDGERLTETIEVTITTPPLERIDILAPGASVYAGTSLDLSLEAWDIKGRLRPNPEVKWESSAPAIAKFDAFGRLDFLSPGRFVARARSEGVEGTIELEVAPNPVANIRLAAETERARTGDVVHFLAEGRTAAGALIADAPIKLAVIAEPDDTLGEAASGQVTEDGRFVAETPGRYTVVATCGSAAAYTSIRIDKRELKGKFKLVGRGEVDDMHTSDLWVWEGADGRDYAVTGTWGAGGDAIFWDVTDPEKIERISTVTVDARTVNDVKVSGDGSLCIISREGASNRKNGIVLIDVLDPRDPKIVSTFDDELTGGVHNLFIDGDQVYALSAGRRYDVINIADRANPHRIGTYELDTPGHSIHDVWIEDGLAYSSNWGDGVHIVDVGNGLRGGSPQEPAFVASYAYPSGWNHAAFPLGSPGDERFYVVAGDEAFPFGLNLKNRPTYPRGWIHFIDFSDLENPEEVARYEVPEAGTHNLWIEDGICYVAYYNGGLRAVDVTGELMGDLYRQGREIAFFLPDAPEGYIANAPMAWGPQPYKGHIFFSDWNSGLWCVKLELEGQIASATASDPDGSPAAPDSRERATGAAAGQGR